MLFRSEKTGWPTTVVIELNNTAHQCIKASTNFLLEDDDLAIRDCVFPKDSEVDRVFFRPHLKNRVCKDMSSKSRLDPLNDFAILFDIAELDLFFPVFHKL